MSQLMFWNKQNNNSNNNNNASNSSNNSTTDSKNGKRNWLHAPDALVNGHVVYLVKFFGSLQVEQAKGIEVVKEAIRKLQFAQQMKKAETGTQEKFKKVEITISVDGVAVQEPRTQKILYQFPLHNISYCADEKGVKKFFSFIAKTVKTLDGSTVQNVGNDFSGSTSNNNTQESHECFLFISNKLASDITLTIGQAFDLAYRKYINNTEKPEGKGQHQVSELENMIAIYKNRLRELSLKIPKMELENILLKMGIKDILEVPTNDVGCLSNGNTEKSLNEDKLLIDTNASQSMKSSASAPFVPLVPPRNNVPNQITHKSNNQKMEELLLNSDSDSDFDPRAEESVDSSTGKNDSNDLFGFEPSKSYGQQLFNNNNDNKLQNNNNNNSSNNNIILTNELNVTPLLAPPPKAGIPRRSTSVMNSNNTNLSNGKTDLFGSDPFELNEPSIFKNKAGVTSVEEFSLESLDPLRK